MSWSKCPRKDETTKKLKYVVPTRKGRRGTMEYYLTPELEAEFRRLYPVTMNRDLIGLFGLGLTTIQRMKRELGLKKDDKVIKRKHTSMVKRICEKNGYYDSLRGKKPSPQCIEALRQWWEEGRHPKTELREKDPRRYRAMCRRESETRKAQFAEERRRVHLGLEQRTALHIPQFSFTKQQISARHNAVKRGYILGDMRERFGERYIIFWSLDTERSATFEGNLRKYGFTLRELHTPKVARKRDME